jgi:chemotaxis protein methyltransferase CheR
MSMSETTSAAQGYGRVLPFISSAELATRILSVSPIAPPVGLHPTVAEALTIRETSFFRSPSMFHVLGESILPTLIERNRRGRRLRVWSAGCATGQEAYSLAMLLCDRFPELGEWDVQVVGTDISRQACAYAQRGRYRRFEINRGLPARSMLKYFEPADDVWSVCNGLRRMVRFRCQDLRAPTMQSYDLVLLRNVLLYLSPAERVRALAGVYLSLRPGAKLIVGSAEQIEETVGLFDPYTVDDQCFYTAVSA